MSKESVEAIIGKAVLDSEFREALFANPEEVLAGFDLTEEEIAALKAIDFETMESFAGTLDERVSKSIFNLQVDSAPMAPSKVEPDFSGISGGGTGGQMRK